MTTKAIVMGGGQSLYDGDVIDYLLDHYIKDEDNEKLKDVTILSTDRTLKYVLEKGIVPDYTAIQENLFPATRFTRIDYMEEFFNHDIVKANAKEITLYYAQALRWFRARLLRAMGFTMKPFNRHGLGGSLKPLIYTCGHCSQALVEIARYVLNIDKVATIGMDMDCSRSWKIYEKDVHHAQKTMLQSTLKRTHTSFLNTGKPVYNLTRKGNFHYTGVVETNIEDFLNDE